MIAQDPSTQLDLWNEAVQMLGGQRPAARVLGCSERTVRGLCSGERPIHEGWLRDISIALLALAERARLVERKLSPAFVSNLVDGQAQEDGRRLRFQQDEKAVAKRTAILSKMSRALQIISDKKDPGIQWRIGESVYALIATDAQVQPSTIFHVPYVVVPDADIPSDCDFDIVMMG